MHPPVGAEDFAFDLADSVDVPVLLRSDGVLRRPREPRWRRARKPWPTTGQLPADSEYLVTTTWRQILHSATSVGRDLSPWLRKTPALAVNELIARTAPLQAYLCLKKVPAPAHGGGRRLFVSAVYQHGTERSAHAAFGYHLGMTMAEWLTVGMAGLGASSHLEAGGVPAFLNPNTKLPDLWGAHAVENLPWLIEAKARKNLNAGDLAKGKLQLDGGSTSLNVPHRQVLCGTSLPREGRWETDHLFMVVNTTLMTPPPGPGDGPAIPLRPPSGGDHEELLSNTDALLPVTRQQLLVYRALVFGAVEDLRIVPISRDRAGRARAATGTLTPLERDEPTAQVRRRLRQDLPRNAEGLRSRLDVDDFVAARIPGTGLHLGMSRRLFAACDALHPAQVSAT